MKQFLDSSRIRIRVRRCQRLSTTTTINTSVSLCSTSGKTQIERRIGLGREGGFRKGGEKAGENESGSEEEGTMKGKRKRGADVLTLMMKVREEA